MKKIMMICLCFMLMGCGSQQKPSSYVDEPKDKEDDIGWVGTYQRGDVTLIIMYDEEVPNGFEFNMELGEIGFGEFTRYIQDDKKKAICDTTEDGYTLLFTLKGDNVIVEESGGISYLETDLNGEYKRQ